LFKSLEEAKNGYHFDLLPAYDKLETVTKILGLNSFYPLLEN